MAKNQTEFEAKCYARFSQNLKQLREQKGMTHWQVAQILGVDRSSYSYYELGRHVPPVKKFIAIALLFGVSADWLLFHE